MTKRISTIIALIGVFCTVLLGGCAFDGLKTYKSVQSEKLQCYADRRGQENFDDESWNLICELVASGKEKISSAKSKSTVNSIVAQTKLSIDEVEPQEWDSTMDGVYYITDESWEAHIRTVAEQVGADASCVESVLNGGSAGEWSSDLRPKNYYWCVILNRKITVGVDIRSFVYQISQEDNVYVGSTVNQSVTFWFQDGDLYLPYGKETLCLRKDDSYRLTENTRTLAAPKEIEIVSSGEEGLDFFHLRWNYDYDYGTLGVGVDVKKADEEVYRTIKIEQVWMNQFVIQLDKSQFAEGDNWVRLYSVGGPYFWNDKTMALLENSEYALFCVTVKGDKVTVREVENT